MVWHLANATEARLQISGFKIRLPTGRLSAHRLKEKSTFSLSDTTGLPLIDLTPEMHSNIMLDHWETPKSFGIDPVVASGGRFEGYYPHSVTYNHTALYWDTQQ